MPIATTQFNDPGSALTALLTQGVGAINNAVNKAINVGQDRATLQLNQENTLFRVMDNEKNLQLRKAEDLRRNFETDRLFGRSVQRDTRTDFVNDRGFFAAQSNADRSFNAAQTNANRSYDLALKNSASADQARKDTLAINASKNERGAIKDTLDILNLQQNSALKSDLLDTQRALKDRALSDPTTDFLATPSGGSKLPASSLSNYVDLFGTSNDPEVLGNVNAAKRELATREPGIDPGTGRVIPQKFAGDKTDPFKDLTDPQDLLFVAQDISKEITDIQKDLTAPNTSSRTKAVLLKRVDELKNKLRKAPVSVQKLSGITPDPGETAVSSLFTKPPPK